jgi:rhamnose transport system ATP-binding protein
LPSRAANAAGAAILAGCALRLRHHALIRDMPYAYVSEDRRQLGLSLPMSISANISLPVLRRYLNRLGLIRTSLEKATAEAFRTRLAIRAPSVDLAVAKFWRQPAEGHAQQVAKYQAVSTDP